MTRCNHCEFREEGVALSFQEGRLDLIALCGFCRESTGFVKARITQLPLPFDDLCECDPFLVDAIKLGAVVRELA